MYLQPQRRKLLLGLTMLFGGLIFGVATVWAVTTVVAGNIFMVIDGAPITIGTEPVLVHPNETFTIRTLHNLGTAYTLQGSTYTTVLAIHNNASSFSPNDSFPGFYAAFFKATSGGTKWQLFQPDGFLEKANEPVLSTPLSTTTFSGGKVFRLLEQSNVTLNSNSVQVDWKLSFDKWPEGLYSLGAQNVLNGSFSPDPFNASPGSFQHQQKIAVCNPGRIWDLGSPEVNKCVDQTRVISFTAYGPANDAVGSGTVSLTDDQGTVQTATAGSNTSPATKTASVLPTTTPVLTVTPVQGYQFKGVNDESNTCGQAMYTTTPPPGNVTAPLPSTGTVYVTFPASAISCSIELDFEVVPVVTNTVTVYAQRPGTGPASGGRVEIYGSPAIYYEAIPSSSFSVAIPPLTSVLITPAAGYRFVGALGAPVGSPETVCVTPQFLDNTSGSTLSLPTGSDTVVRAELPTNSTCTIRFGFEPLPTITLNAFNGSGSGALAVSPAPNAYLMISMGPKDFADDLPPATPVTATSASTTVTMVIPTGLQAEPPSTGGVYCPVMSGGYPEPINGTGAARSITFNTTTSCTAKVVFKKLRTLNVEVDGAVVAENTVAYAPLAAGISETGNNMVAMTPSPGASQPSMSKRSFLLPHSAPSGTTLSFAMTVKEGFFAESSKLCTGDNVYSIPVTVTGPLLSHTSDLAKDCTMKVEFKRKTVTMTLKLIDPPASAIVKACESATSCTAPVATLPLADGVPPVSLETSFPVDFNAKAYIVSSVTDRSKYAVEMRVTCDSDPVLIPLTNGTITPTWPHTLPCTIEVTYQVLTSAVTVKVVGPQGAAVAVTSTPVLTPATTLVVDGAPSPGQGTVQIVMGSSYSFALAPNTMTASTPGSEIVSVIDSGTVTTVPHSGSTYTASNIIAPRTITVTLARKKRDITFKLQDTTGGDLSWVKYSLNDTPVTATGAGGNRLRPDAGSLLWNAKVDAHVPVEFQVDANANIKASATGCDLPTPSVSSDPGGLLSLTVPKISDQASPYLTCTVTITFVGVPPELESSSDLYQMRGAKFTDRVSPNSIQRQFVAALDFDQPMDTSPSKEPILRVGTATFTPNGSWSLDKMTYTGTYAFPAGFPSDPATPPTPATFTVTATGANGEALSASKNTVLQVIDTQPPSITPVNSWTVNDMVMNGTTTQSVAIEIPTSEWLSTTKGFPQPAAIPEPSVNCLNVVVTSDWEVPTAIDNSGISEPIILTINAIVGAGEQGLLSGPTCTVAIPPAVAALWLDTAGNALTSGSWTIKLHDDTNPYLRFERATRQDGTTAQFVRPGELVTFFFTASEPLGQGGGTTYGSMSFSGTTTTIDKVGALTYKATLTVPEITPGTHLQIEPTYDVQDLEGLHPLSDATTITGTGVYIDTIDPEIDYFVKTNTDVALRIEKGIEPFASIVVDPSGGCTPARSALAEKSGTAVNRLTDFVNQNVGTTMSCENGLDRLAGRARIWYRVHDLAGNDLASTASAHTDLSGSYPQIIDVDGTNWLKVDVPLDLASILRVDYDLSPTSTVAHCDGNAPTGCVPSVDVVVRSVAFGDGQAPSSVRAYVKKLGESPEPETVYELELPNSDNLRGWQLLSAGTNARTFPYATGSVTDDYARYAIAFGATNTSGDTAFTIGTQILTLDRRAAATPTITGVNGKLFGIGNVTVSEPNGNVSPTISGEIDDALGTQNRDGFITLELFRTGDTTRVGIVGPFRTSDGLFSATYVIRPGSDPLTTCNATDDGSACTYDVRAVFTTRTNQTSDASALRTFRINGVRGSGSFTATQAPDSIIANGDDHYDLALIVRDAYGNRVPDSDLGCFTADGESISADCETNGKQVLLPRPADGQSSPPNIDLIADDDEWSESAILVGQKSSVFTPELAIGAADAPTTQGALGTFTGQLYGLAPSIDTKRYLYEHEAVVVNPNFGQPMAMDVDMKFALSVPCTGCELLGADLDAMDPADARTATLQAMYDAMYARSAEGLTEDPVLGGALPAPLFHSATSATDAQVLAKLVAANANPDYLVYSPRDATLHPNWAADTQKFRTALTSQIPTIRVTPLVTAAVRQIGSDGIRDLTEDVSVLKNGGFETLTGADAARFPTGFANDTGMELVSVRDADGVANVMEGLNALRANGSAATVTAEAVPVRAKGTYDIRAYVKDTAPATLTATLGSAAPITLAAVTGAENDAPAGWQLYRGTFEEIAAADVPSSSTMRLELRVPNSATVDSVAVTQKANTERVAAQVTPLILGSATRWQVDIKNEGVDTIAINPISTIASLNFRYGTAVWGDFSEMQLSYCDPVCDTALELLPNHVVWGTQNLEVKICKTGSVDCLTPTPIPYEVAAGDFLQLSFTATAGMATERVASTQGLAETTVDFAFQPGTAFEPFIRLYQPDANPTDGRDPGPRYLSNALALDIFNPIASITDAPTPRTVARFTPSEMAGIRQDITHEVVIATRVKSDTEACGVGELVGQSAACIQEEIIARRTFAVTGSLATALDDAGLNAHRLNDVATVLPDDGTLPSDAIGDERILPTFVNNTTILVPGNLVLAPNSPNGTICLPEGDHVLIVRGNLILRGNLRFTSVGTVDNPATCTVTDAALATKTFGLIVLPLPAIGVDQASLGETSSFAGGNIFLDPAVSLIQGSIYTDGAILPLQPGQDTGNLTAIVSLDDALVNTGGIRLVADDTSRTSTLKNQLLFADGHVISMQNTWGGAEAEQPEDRDEDERLLLDLSKHRMFKLDANGAVVGGGNVAPGIQLYGEHRGDSVIIANRPAGSTLPPLFARIGLFRATEVGAR